MGTDRSRGIVRDILTHPAVTAEQVTDEDVASFQEMVFSLGLERAGWPPGEDWWPAMDLSPLEWKLRNTALSLVDHQFWMCYAFLGLVRSMRDLVGFSLEGEEETASP